MKKSGQIIPIVGIVIALAAVAFGVYSLNRMPDSEFPEFRPAFSLHSVNGPFKLSDIRGKVGMIFFGYAHCPDVCPATMVNFGRTLDLLSDEEKSKVRAIFVSLDPDRDTPEIMAKYTGFFSDGIIGLTGSVDEVTAAAKSFEIAYEHDKPNTIGNYSMNHSTYIFIVRPDGKLGRLMGHQSEPEAIAEELRYWMKWAE